MKAALVHFVGFITKLAPDQFIPEFEPHAKKLQHKKQETDLLELAGETKNKFRYISKHEWPGTDFHFSFMNERNSEFFPEHNVRVNHIGGYTRIHTGNRSTGKEGYALLIAFITHNEKDMQSYQLVPHFHQLDIYQAYYESCAYGHILEYHVPTTHAEELLSILQQRPGVEAGLYKTCSVIASPHA